MRTELLFVTAALTLAACADPAKPTGSPPSPSAATTAAPGAAGPCRTYTQPAEGRSTGKAHLVIAGGGLDVDVPDAQAVCGPYYVRELVTSRRTYPAGSGLVFEACWEGGTIQFASDTDNSVGKRAIGPDDAAFKVILNTKDHGSWLFDRHAPSSAEVAPGARAARFETGIVSMKAGPPKARVTMDVRCE